MNKTEMKTVPIEQAIGMVLGHDITKIVPGIFKGAAFKKGHIIKKEDIPKFLEIGKDNIYVLDLQGKIHENDAALRIATAAVGKNIKLSEPSEGKISLTRYFQTFVEGDNVMLKMEPAKQNGAFHPRFMGCRGRITGKQQGKCYYVTIKDQKKEKTVIVHPLHLKRLI